MKFEEVLPFLRQGKMIRREGWIYAVSLKKGVFLNDSPYECPFEFIYDNGHVDSFNCSDEGPLLADMDLLADDWEISE